MFCGKTNLNELEKMQERALRFVFRDTTSSYESLLERGNFLPFSAYRIRCLGIETYKCFHGLNPDYLNKLFKQSSTKYNLRDSYRLEQLKFNTFSYGQRSFRYYGSKLWNLLLFSVKNTNDLNIFQTKITRWCYIKQCAAFDVFWKSRFAASCLSFIPNSCAWCGNDDLFLFFQIIANSYIYSFFSRSYIWVYTTLFPVAMHTVLNRHLCACILLFPFRCSDINLISILTI